MNPKIYVHGSYVGTTGYNNHTRDFFRELSKYCQLKVRNFTVGKSWSGYSENCHNGETYLDDVDKNLLYKQILWVGNNKTNDFKIYPSPEKEFFPDFNIVLNETNHHLYYHQYAGPKIAFNVWESTRQPEDFFNKLKEFDELWVPSEWQKQCTIEQGYDPEKIRVVPEGVDVHTFFPEEVEPLEEFKDGRFKFILFGRWDYRKSTKEIIQTFLKTFSPNEPVDLIVSIDNMWGEQMDGYKTTEERLAAYGLVDERVKIVHFPSREDYIKYLKTGHVFVSCARSEGWNLPLIEAMACGTPSIYSDCCAQLQFAKGRGIPVNIIGEKPANQHDYARFQMSDVPGNYYEPDFNHLSEMMRLSYEKYDTFKKTALVDSKYIREEFSWEKIGEIGYNAVMDFYNKIKSEEYKNSLSKNKIYVSYLNGPKVEIKGDKYEEYFVEFLDDKDSVIYSDTIHNNMWTECSRKYFTNWKIKINGEVVDKFDCSGKRVLISFESKSIGDTIAWTPYALDFAKKNNCKVILSTFHNDWFKNLEYYSDIEFLEPGKSTDVYCIYRIGWFRGENGLWDKLDSYPNILNTIPLQQTATDILGLPYYEIHYGIDYKVRPRPIQKKYIVFGPNSTAGAKEWRYENWVELSEMIKKEGYEIVTLTQKPFQIDGVKNVSGKPMQEVMNYLFHADLFIGLASGLSWLNWVLGKKTVMISGFSKDSHEFKTNVIRISNDVCIKCWNDPVLSFDAGDWNWCPVYKGTKNQHICQTSITPIQVFTKLGLKPRKKYLYPEGEENLTQNFLREIFDENEYNRFGITVEPGDVVLDAGANVGIFANYASEMGSSKIFSYEMSEKFYECLVKNTSDLSTSNNLGKIGADNYTIERILAENNLDKLDFAKIDIEGSEWEFFEKMKDEEMKSVKKWAIEFHTSYHNSQINDLEKKTKLWKFLKILDKFRKNGFQIHFEHIHEGWDVVHLFTKKI